MEKFSTCRICLTEDNDTEGWVFDLDTEGREEAYCYGCVDFGTCASCEEIVGEDGLHDSMTLIKPICQNCVDAEIDNAISWQNEGR